VIVVSGCGMVSRVTTHTFAYHEALYHQITGPAAVIELHNTAGEVTIAPWDKPGINISANRRAPTLREAVDTKIDIEQTGTKLTITSEFGSDLQGRNVLYVIHAPAGTTLDLHQSAGTITVDDWSGSITADQTAGNIAISMRQLRSPQHLTAHCSAGNVTLTIPKASDARFDAKVGVGALTDDFALPVERHVVGATLSGSLGSGAAPVEVRLTTGNLAINSP